MTAMILSHAGDQKVGSAVIIMLYKDTLIGRFKCLICCLEMLTAINSVSERLRLTTPSVLVPSVTHSVVTEIGASVTRVETGLLNFQPIT